MVAEACGVVGGVGCVALAATTFLRAAMVAWLAVDRGLLEAARGLI